METESKQSEYFRALEVALAKLTDAQHAALKAMQSEFKDHAYARDDFNLLRFLRARQFNLDAARDMFSKHLEWRKANLPIPYSEVHPELRKGKWFARGHDKQGRPIVVVRGRNFDPTVRNLNTAARSLLWLVEDIFSEGKVAPGVTFATILYDRHALYLDCVVCAVCLSGCVGAGQITVARTPTWS